MSFEHHRYPRAFSSEVDPVRVKKTRQSTKGEWLDWHKLCLNFGEGTIVVTSRSSNNPALTSGGIPGVFQLNDEGIHHARFQL
jgi:hypothetical protein